MRRELTSPPAVLESANQGEQICGRQGEGGSSGQKTVKTGTHTLQSCLHRATARGHVGLHGGMDHCLTPGGTSQGLSPLRILDRTTGPCGGQVLEALGFADSAPLPGPARSWRCPADLETRGKSCPWGLPLCQQAVRSREGFCSSLACFL